VRHEPRPALALVHLATQQSADMYFPDTFKKCKQHNTSTWHVVRKEMPP
jgi:hypothetical protein